MPGRIELITPAEAIRDVGNVHVPAAMRFQPSLTPAFVAGNTTAEQTFTLAGIILNDVIVAINKPTAQAGLGIVGMRVSTTSQIAITFSNINAASATITPTAAEIYQVLVLRGR